MLAFAIWAGQFNANFLNVETLKCFGMADTSSGVIIGSPAYSFNGGFAIVIIAWLLSPLSAGILFWKQNEVEHVDPAEAAAAGGGGGSDAVQDAFPSAGAPPLPPGTVPYGGGGGGGAPYAGGAGSGPYGGGGGVPYAPPGVPAYDNVT